MLDRYGVFNWAIWRNASSPFFATTATELLMGVLLLQQMRVIERRMGSQKYAVRTPFTPEKRPFPFFDSVLTFFAIFAVLLQGLTFLAASLASVLQFSTIALFPGKNFVFSGPYATFFEKLQYYSIISLPSPHYPNISEDSPNQLHSDMFFTFIVRLLSSPRSSNTQILFPPYPASDF